MTPTESVVFERQGVSTLLIAPRMRDIYFNDPKSLERHCRAPGPDVSVESSSGVSFSVPMPTGEKDQIGEDNKQSALSLGGRNPAVLIARELMYRACELSSNLNADQKTTLLIYERFLQSLEKVSAVQNTSGTASLVDSGINSKTNSSGDDNTSDSNDSSTDDISVDTSSDTSSDTTSSSW